MRFITLVFAGAFVLSLFVTYLVRTWAIRFNLVDVPDGQRRLHERPVPRVGGIAVFSAVAVILAIAYVVLLRRGELAPSLNQMLALAGGGAAMFALGLWDDVRSLPAKRKLLFQTGIAVAVFFAGLRIGTVTPLAGHVFQLSWPASLIITVLWLVGLANAFNLIDGSDGIAAGGALFASLTLAIVAILSGNVIGATISLALAGATLGFLFFNFPPATIFLGDSGSLFLGYTLAAIGILSVGKAPTLLAVTIPVVSCALPILDTLLTMVRRFLRRDPILLGDRGHIHHRLRDLGHSPREVALLLYAGFAGFAMLSLLLVQTPGPAVASVFIIAGAILLVAVQRLNIPELLEFSRVFQRGLKQRRVIAHNVRIRQAANEVRSAEDAAGVIQGFRKAFDSGEFSKVELCLYGEELYFEPSDGLDVKIDRVRAEQRIVLADICSQRRQWEMQLPLRDSEGNPIGHLCLWHDTDSEYLLTDVRLLALHLQPEIIDALIRLRYASSGHTDDEGAAAQSIAVNSGGRRMRLKLES